MTYMSGIFTSELFRSYKPNKKIYQSAAPPHNMAMVAAHRFNLIAAFLQDDVRTTPY
ncbi:hypothetical protein F4604DRAFT_1750413 [Suillus subluteus]|nr:hypothetical protein F4604DRAFT_1750413 [Suillus subluteus]